VTSTSVPTYRVLVVDDEPRMIAMVKELLKEDLPEHLRSIEFTEAEDFETAQKLLTEQDFDLAVLDVRDAPNGRPAAEYEARGHTLYDAIARTRWLPVVFFTGVPQQVSDLEAPPLVSVVTKNDLDRLGPAVEAGLRSGVSELRRRITELVEAKTRLFMGETVAPHWAEFAKAGADQDDLAMIIVNRLAVELRENALQEMGYARNEVVDSGAHHVPPARVYLMPTVTRHLTTTDLLLDANGDWWIVLTPACDLYEDDPEKVAKPRTAKAQYGRVAKADRVLTREGGSESPVIARWLESSRAGKDKNLAKPAFGDNQNRYRYLPGFLDIPHLLVDFENVRSVPLEDLRDEKKYRRVATLDSPFSEGMVNAYSRSVGRIGIPDIDTFGIRLELGLEKPKLLTMPRQSQAPAPDGEIVRD
jgi:CheY-like chemotaxis protein